MIIILGPTASGKTKLAALLADKLNGEVISADSRQVYRGMNLGTGKDYADYLVGGKKVQYHLIDIAEPGEEYNVFRYQQDFTNVFKDVISRKKIPLLCGGTGLYIEAVLSPYDFKKVPINEELRASLQDKSQEELVNHLKLLRPLHNTTDIFERERTLRAIEISVHKLANATESTLELPTNQLIIGVAYERKALRQRITLRLQQRLQQGMIAEVEDLLNKGISPEKLDFYGLEYRYITRYLSGVITQDEMFSRLNTAIHQFAKRQMTWFRRMERKGFQIRWLPGKMKDEDKLEVIMNIQNMLFN